MQTSGIEPPTFRLRVELRRLICFLIFLHFTFQYFINLFSYLFRKKLVQFFMIQICLGSRYRWEKRIYLYIFLLVSIQSNNKNPEYQLIMNI